MVRHAKNAADLLAFILVHNPPTGNRISSRDGVEITGRLSDTGDLMEVRVLDHSITGDGRYTSFADCGLI